MIHLMRGQVFELNGLTFFTIGGASSHDIEEGILDPTAPSFKELYADLRNTGGRFRVKHRSWWEEELPSPEEYGEAKKNLERVNYKVDYIVTHCAPSSVVDLLSGGRYDRDHLTEFLEKVKSKADFHYWLFGHYHDNKIIDERFVLLWEQIVKVL